MDRDQATNKLRRMVNVINTGSLPAKILGLYVFGSYSRGALAPSDLDVIVWYADPDPKLLEECKRKTRESARNISEQYSDGVRRFESQIGKRLRNPGEKMDLMFTMDLEKLVTMFQDVSREEFRIIWSPIANDIDLNLSALPVDATAGRAPRHQFASPKRIGTDRESVEMITEMLDNEQLRLIRIPIELKYSPLNGQYLELFDRWTEREKLGRETLKCLPFAMQWLQSERAKKIRINQTMIWDDSHTRRVQMGKLHLGHLCWYFGRFPKMKRQCLIPHIKRDEPNEFFIFERGPNWKLSDYAKIEPYSLTDER